ncbi:hypothetical protein M422DRAFT_22838 [Sphaerobolus stellatus SS14]|nr:hypothetical protein M422DRAFT_22838 [Sphaerobolus stellatus SS14]
MEISSPQSSRPSSPLLSAAPIAHRPISQLTLALLDNIHTNHERSAHRRLLIPTVRHARSRRGVNKAGKRHTRVGSVSGDTHQREAKEWVASFGKMVVVEEQLEVRGFQIHAVEKWIVERGRLVNVICVYTGDQSHKIHVTVLSPYVTLKEDQAQAEFDKALYMLRRDGARPRETEHGILMVTSLANFRSDYNLVLIPDGNFLAAREQLYVNINLLRMGCSGRSTLTLAEPSEPTKDRYLYMYCFAESMRSKVSFNQCVLDLVKLVQCALLLFGFFPSSSEERDGLLCDTTTEGIMRWTESVGEPVLSLEPMERVGDPSVVSALLSLVVTMGNKLQALGFTQAPKDPFQEPQAFMHTVAAFNTQAQKIQPKFSPTNPSWLCSESVKFINDSYDRSKARGSEYSVHRMLLSKFDGITTDLNLRSGDSTFTGHVYPTSDLAAFVQMMINAGSKDVVESLKALWTGKTNRRKKTKGGIDEEDRDKTDGKTTDDDEVGIFPSWGRHMKIEGFRNFDFGLGRSKKPSVDLSAKSKQSSLSADEAPPTAPPMLRSLPQLVISGDSGAENSPYSGTHSSLISRDPSPHSSNPNIESVHSPKGSVRYAAFPKRLPSRLSTASEPMSSSTFSDRPVNVRHSSAYEPRLAELEEDHEDLQENERKVNREVLLGSWRRRHSMDDLSKLRDTEVLPVDRMKIDVGLCGQYLIMHRREIHLQNIITLLDHFNTSVGIRTTKIEDELIASEAAADATTRLRHEVWSAIDHTESHLSDWANTQDLLNYQTDEMELAPLWRSVREQRARTLEARQNVFPAPSRKRISRQPISRTHFRMQSTLEPDEFRLVDWFGRTESEAEEEIPIPKEDNGQPPLFDEVQAWSAAHANSNEGRVKQRKWWWPFGRDNMSDDETATQSANDGR